MTIFQPISFNQPCEDKFEEGKAYYHRDYGFNRFFIIEVKKKTQKTITAKLTQFNETPAGIQKGGTIEKQFKIHKDPYRGGEECILYQHATINAGMPYGYEFMKKWEGK